MIIPLQVTDYENLVAILKVHLPTTSPWLLGIDGARGARKTTLATQIAKTMGACVVSLDLYLKTEADSYVERVLAGTFSDALKIAREASDRVIVEGICLRAVLQRAAVEPTLMVYVQRLTKTGIPVDFEFVDDDLSEAEMLARIGGGASAGAALDREIGGYHKRMRPHHTADVIYQWTES